MAPRLNKRQIREQEELAALAAAKEAESNDEAESGNDQSVWSKPQKPQGSGFAALGPEHGDTSESEASGPSQVKETKKKKKKKTKKATEVSNTSEPAAIESPRPPKAKKQKATKQSKQKAREDQGDDIDRALAELSLKYPGVSAASQSNATTRSSNTLFSLLVVSLSNLDSEAEMRKFFGAKVVSASKASTSNAMPRRRPVTTRSNLTNPQPTWWPATLRQGLSVRLLSDEELEQRRARHGLKADLSGERHWTVEYSKKYKGATRSFIHMVMSGDPEGFWQLLRTFPYHADTLLQLSEVYSHREEHSTAADFIDRALFTYERAFIGSFNFTMGTNRLDFDHVENRPFFLALHRQVADLHRRGCVLTAFEFAKLLYSLDPRSDPHGSLLHLDFLAIKSGQAQWLLDVWNAHAQMDDTTASGYIHAKVLPGWAYARALALYTIENTKNDLDHIQSSAALKEAIQQFPSVVPLLADKADIPLSSEIRSCPAFRIRADASSVSTEPEAVLHLLSHLYAQRSHPLWKTKKDAQWFASTVALTFAESSFSKAAPKPLAGFSDLFTSSRLAYSVYRHVLVLETSYRSLFAFFPSTVVSARQLACDPLPPPTRVTEYNADFFAGAEDPLSNTSRSRKQNERLLERLIPDPAFRRQLQGFFEAHPQIAQRFPGGVIQFAQLAAQLPEDALEDLLFAELAAEEGAQMPGFFGEVDAEQNVNEERGPPQDAAEGDDNYDSVGDEAGLDEEDEPEEAIAPLPLRLWRNVFNRLWGGNEEAPEPAND